MKEQTIQMIEAHDAANEAYAEWVLENKEDLTEQYTDQLTEFPEHIYENVCDDDYTDAEELYASNLEFKDVPEWFMQSAYERYCDSEGYDEDAAYEAERDRDEVGLQ